MISAPVRERVLVLDAHTNQALACVRSLGRAGHEVFVASHRALPLAAWSTYCRGRFRLDRESVEAFAELRAWAAARRMTVVLPLTERACLLCNAERDAWEALGIVVGCGPNEMLLRAFDKAETARYAAASGAALPPTRAPRSLAECRAAAQAVGFPCVVKPRFSNVHDGFVFQPGESARYVGHPDQLDAAIEATRQGDRWPLIQGFVPGAGKGVFALCNHGEAVAWFAHERLRDVRPSGSGSSLRRAIALDPRLRAPAERLLRQMQWHGPAMVEFRDDGAGAPYLIEVNGRFWGSLQLAVSAGVDFPCLWLDLLRGRTVTPPRGYVEGVTLRFVWGDVKRLLFILAGAPAGYPGAYPTVWQGVRELLGAQPPGTLNETWSSGDRWPAVGEVLQGVRELATRVLRRAPSPVFTGATGDRRRLGGSRLTVRKATPTEELEWDTLVRRFEHQRVVHTRGWLRSLEASGCGRPLYLIFERDQEIVGCLPGLFVRLGLLRLFGSPLPGWQTVSMGPLFDPRRVSTAELTAALVPFLQRHYRIHHIELMCSHLDPDAMQASRFRGAPVVTYRAALHPGDEAATLKTLKDSARRNVRRAIKLGLVTRFETDEAFVDEHYSQIKEVYARRGFSVPFGKRRVLEFFRHLKAAGSLLAVAVYLRDGGPCIATGMFTIDDHELLLSMWTHRTQYRWYRPTELMTWTVMQQAVARGCDSFDLMGRGDFKAKFGAVPDASKRRWVWSRYAWLTPARGLAERAYRWQQAVRGRLARLTSAPLPPSPVEAGQVEDEPPARLPSRAPAEATHA